MRKILHRGKAELSNDKLDELQVPHDDGWVYGNVVIDGHIAFIISGITEWDEEYFAPKWWVRVDKDTIGQFTGLHDKNDKRIFEGDVVEMHQFLFDGNEYEHETKGAIKWGEYGWLLSQIEGEAVNKYMGYKNGEGETYFINFYGLHEESFEIIGNIHDEVSP